MQEEKKKNVIGTLLTPDPSKARVAAQKLVDKLKEMAETKANESKQSG